MKARRTQCALVLFLAACHHATSRGPATPSPSDGVQVHFSVADSSTGARLGSVMIILDSARYGAMTSATGEAWLAHVLPGSYRLFAQRCPYELKGRITVTGDSAQTISLLMVRQSTCVGPRLLGQ